MAWEPVLTRISDAISAAPRGALAGAVLALTLTLAACGSAPSQPKNELTPYVEAPVEKIYDVAFKLLKQKKYALAAAAFEEVERQHPYSIWARRAMLMSAFANYQANEYDSAIDAADRFISLHPGNVDAPYAYYLKAICSYEQIQDSARDQQKTLDAMAALQDVVRRFPGSEYARDAQLKLDFTRDQLAAKEMYVGRYYLRQGQYIAAIGRFRTVIETYQTTNHVPEALHRLVEAYYALGLDAEAQASAAVLGYNFPDSQWYKDSWKLLSAHGLISVPASNTAIQPILPSATPKSDTAPGTAPKAGAKSKKSDMPLPPAEPQTPNP
ncbi:MAG: outer membrane protein assembly factor BamD [Alphaproteobacteria bacterium]